MDTTVNGRQVDCLGIESGTATDLRFGQNGFIVEYYHEEGHLPVNVLGARCGSCLKIQRRMQIKGSGRYEAKVTPCWAVMEAITG